MRKVYLFLGLLSISYSITAQVTMTTTGSYSQDFNTLNTSGSTTWTDNTTIANWYAQRSGSGNTIVANDGSSNAGNLYSYGTGTSSDRALGSVGSGGATAGNFAWGLLLQNTSGTTITDIRIGYIGEQWRNSGAAAAQTVSFYYKISSSIITSLDPNNNGSWTPVVNLHFTSPIATGGATSLDGNNATNQSGFANVIIPSLSLNNGEYIMIKWDDPDHGGSDHGMAIDDFIVNWIVSSNVITTGTVSTPPFLLSDCSDTETGNVSFASTGTFNGGNIMTVQLSNEIGSFASPVNIGSAGFSGVDPGGSIAITIPAGTVSGTGYKVRVVSSDPAVNGSESATFTIVQSGFGGCNSAVSDHYRSQTTGDWATPATWESSPNGTDWISATLSPTSLANTITIRNTHSVTISTAQTADQLTIQSGGTLINAQTAALFLIENGSGDDMTINGGGKYQITSTLAYASYQGLATSATVRIQTLGVIQIGNGGGMTGGGHNGFAITPASYIWETGAIFDWNTSSFPGISGATYFPDALLTIPVLRFTTAPGATMGGTGTMTVNGVLEANTAVTFSGNADYIFRNGILGTGNVTQVAGTGDMNINGTLAGFGGSGIVIANNSLNVGSATGTVLTLVSNKTVTGIINLVNLGLIDVGTFDLTVSNRVDGGNTTNYVRTTLTGRLVLQSVDNDIFPVGMSSYNPITFTNGGNITYAVRVTDGIVPAVAFPNYGINRTWTIQASAANTGVILTFQYAAADANANVSVPENMELLLNDGIAWSVVAGNSNLPTLGSDPYTNTLSTGITITDAVETPFVLGKSGGYILPIDCIITARAQKQGRDGFLTWDINSCAGVVSFELQRAVNNGSFETIQTLTPGTPLVYSAFDRNLANGINLYRVKVNRLGGAIKYSNTVALINDSKGLLITSLAPNPVSDKTNLTISSARSGAIRLNVYSSSGILVKQFNKAVVEGNSVMELDIRELSAGVYYLEALGMDARASFRLVKQ